MFFKQVKHHGDNFSYIIADEATGEAAVVDSSYNADMIIQILRRGNFHLKYIINTHSHSDHTLGNDALRSLFGAKIIAHAQSRPAPDMTVNDGDSIQVDSLKARVLYTPGHAPDSICLLIEEKKLLTGDTLFVGECGRTDMLGGSSRSMYNSLFNKLLKLDDDVEVYPGHDYGSKPCSTIGEEKRSNYTLQPRRLVEFIKFMAQP